MSKKDFELIAHVVSKMTASAVTVGNARHATAEHFANELAKTNPRFDRARFLRACGVDDA